MRLDKKLKKKLLLNAPYVLFVYLFDKAAQGIRLAPGTNDAVRMESNHVIRNVLRQHPRGLALIRDKEIVERVYAFYSKEGVKVVEVRVKIPHRFFSTYSRWRGVEAAKKAVGLALGLLQNGVHCNRKGELEWRRGAEGQFTISEIRTTSPILGTQEGLTPVNMSQ